MAYMLDIRTFGAVGDGKTVNTAAIQKAIDECSKGRHGTVLVAGGDYVTGTIYLKDNVMLHVASGSALLGSTRICDYSTDTHKNMYKSEPHLDRCLIFGRNASAIGIEGNGVIDGRGFSENFPNKEDPQQNRPMLIRLVDCSRIRFRDITLRNPAAWTSAWLYCSDIVVDGITIHSRANYNGDGLDFDGCRNVRVTNCSFDTSDDSICLQTSRTDRPCTDVTISNCIFISQWAGIRIGLLSRGDFSNVTVTNCVFKDIADSGLKIQMCEGGMMKNMMFSNLVMTNVPRPLFVTLCQLRACVDSPEQPAPTGSMQNLVFSNIAADSGMCGKDSAIIILGQAGHPIDTLTLSGIRLTTGGGVREPVIPGKFPDLTQDLLKGWWPEYSCLGMTVPSHGIYADHVSRLLICNSMMETAEADSRPAIACHDIGHLVTHGIAATRGSSPIWLDGKPVCTESAGQSGLRIGVPMVHAP